MAVQIQIRRDTTQNWYEINPILAKGEMGIEYLDNGKTKIKIGNGVDAYDSLDYFADPISYLDLINKPSINNVELNNNTSLIDLGIQPIGNYASYDDVVNGLSLKADADKTYTKEDIDTFFNNLLKIPAIEDQNGKYLKVLDGEIIWSDITGDMVSITKLNEELEKKVDKIDGYSLISIDELQRLSNISNYDDQPIKEDLELLKQEVDTKASINSLDNYVSKNDLSDTLDEYALKSDITSKAEASDLVSHISNTSNPHRVTAEQVGLGNVDNTSDMNKPISIQTQTALNLKQNILTAGNGIVIEDDIITNKSPNVQADWLAEEGLAEILHKPNLATVATSGSYNDLEDKPVIPSEYVLPIASSSQLGGIKVGSGLAISGDGTLKTAGVNNYNDLEHKPSIGGITLIEGQTAEDLDLATSKATQSALNLKADKADTLAGYGITDAYTKEEVEARLSSVYKFKGSVPTYDNLPSENNIIGDVYNVEDTGSNYAWDGTQWDKLSETIDLTPYALKSTTLAGYGITDAYTKEEVDVKIAEKDSLPAQADKQGTFLSTNGTSAFWSTLPESNDTTKGIVKLASAEELTEGTSESSVITVKQFKDNLNLKQDNLIAGNGIAIENNTISATIEVPDNVIISDNYVNAKLWKGTLEEYDLLESHDDSVTYIITDDYTQVDYNYNTLQNKPQINSVELSGNKTLEELGIQASGDYALKSEMELKADKADTLAGYGITDGLSISQITNCITKIPQDIKLELSEDGTLTLKAGSKVYVPNGAGIFDEVVMETDRITKGVSFDGECYIIYDRPTNNIYYRALSQVQVFNDVPTEEISGILEIYCSNENAIYAWNSSTNVWDRKERSLPIALSILQKSEPYIVSLNQVFNGFGYFGNMIFSLPGIECIAPNGRNSDGSLRNTIYLTKMATRVLSMPDIDENRIMYIGSGDRIGNQLTNLAYLDKEKNLVAEKNKDGTFDRYISGGSVIIGPRFIIGNNKIKIFPKNTLQLIDDYNVVHNTGDEEIYGIKTFKDEITAPNQVDYTQITNCITKIPQDIKLELTDGTLTLKAGSKVYIPNGAGVFDEVIIQNDISKQISVGGSFTGLFQYDRKNNTISIVNELGSSGSSTFSGTGLYYNKTDNTIRFYVDGVATNEEMSLPLGCLTSTNNTITSIDQIFNGYGFIGHTIFVLPGVEGLIPNGRNEDGSLNNIKAVTNNVKICNSTTSKNDKTLWTFLTDLNVNYRNSITHYVSTQFINPTIETTATLYNPETNMLYATNDKGQSWIKFNTFILFSYNIDTSGKITKLNRRNSLQIIDINNTDWASNCSKPGSKYNELTLEASGSSYIATANGWFSLWQKDSTASTGKITIRRLSDRFGVGTENSIAGYTNLILPVQKGETVAVYYSSITSTDFQFRFIYDEGAK